MCKLLPSSLASLLLESGKITVLDGDITHENLGLEHHERVVLQRKVTTFIHAASTINLKLDLSRMAQTVIRPSVEAAKIAMTFFHLQKFVYVSTAYVNAFLHFINGKADGSKRAGCIVEESIYDLRMESRRTDPSAELRNLEEFGTTPEYSCIPHSFAYSYAKHLTERLLLEKFREAGLEHILMVFRPSIFAPAVRKPFPHFEVPGSTPATTLLCALLATRPMKLRFASNLLDPSRATVDEIPIDVVVNRLLVHTAHETHGCVHAVAGDAGRVLFADHFNTAIKLRPWWWGRPILGWCDMNDSDRRACLPSKLWKILGCSFAFCDDKTQHIWKSMDTDTKEKWPLMYSCENPHDSLEWSHRYQTAREMLGVVLEKRYGVCGAFIAALIAPQSSKSSRSSSSLALC